MNADPDARQLRSFGHRALLMADRLERQQIALERIAELRQTKRRDPLWGVIESIVELAEETIREQPHRLLPTLERQRAALQKIGAMKHGAGEDVCELMSRIATEALQEQNGS